MTQLRTNRHGEMIDEKDPVREQIERDIEQLCHIDYDMPDQIKEEITMSRNFGISVATNQDKIAWNRCLDDQESVHMDKILKARSRLNNENLPRELVVALEAAITYAECAIEYLKKNRR